MTFEGVLQIEVEGFVVPTWLSVPVDDRQA